MHCHANARLTPRGRATVFELVEAGMTITAACLAARVSRRFYYRWLPRWQAVRQDGLLDRSSRPRTSPQRLSLAQEALVVGVRRRLGWGADRIAALVGLPASTVHRVLRRHELVGRKRALVAIVRYEHADPGGLVHLDTKKLGRIVDGPGHRATGDRRDHRRGVGWEVLHVAIDDATRLVYAELLPDEKGRTTARFLVRALRWFRAQGVRVRRLLTDNGSPYRSRIFGRVARLLGIKHSRTRPYRPQTNGKCERWIRTVLSECLYLEVFGSSEDRRRALERFVAWYNEERPHLGIGGRTPRQRLSEKLWRKLLNATAANLYQADAVLIAGDLTGKAIVPIVRVNGHLEAEVLGARKVARDERELAALEREIADLGYYSVIATADEAARLAGRDERMMLFRRLMSERLEAWLRLAQERLAASPVPILLMPGNDDEFAIDPILDRPGWRTSNVDGRVVDLPGGLEIAALGWSSPTPWSTPREMNEEAFLDRISELLRPVRNLRRTVLMTHVPPYGSGLDTAPLLDSTLRPTVSAGDVLRGPVGSHGVRAAIERFQPILGAHGHIHESGGETRIGRTLAVNAGSEANHGVLRGYLVDIGPDGVERTLRVEG